MIRNVARLSLAMSLLASAAAVPALAENSKPQPVPWVNIIPDARDIPYPGTITLDIDATDTKRGIFATKEMIPVAEAGEMVLLFPKWLPGTHSPTGQLDKVVGLHIRGGGKDIAW